LGASSVVLLVVFVVGSLSSIRVTPVTLRRMRLRQSLRPLSGAGRWASPRSRLRLNDACNAGAVGG
jgi:hypothetical protein